MKIIIGAGGKHLPGYIATDIDPGTRPKIVCSADKLPLADNSLEEIYMSAVYEHLYCTERQRALLEWYRCLSPGGTLQIDWIPDTSVGVELVSMCWGNKCLGCGPTEEFRHWDIVMLERLTCGAVGLHQEKPYQVHKGIFDILKVANEIHNAGFLVNKIDHEVYPGEMGEPYNICVTATKE